VRGTYLNTFSEINKQGCTVVAVERAAKEAVGKAAKHAEGGANTGEEAHAKNRNRSRGRGRNWRHDSDGSCGKCHAFEPFRPTE
jgi:hypothetical protein